MFSKAHREAARIAGRKGGITHVRRNRDKLAEYGSKGGLAVKAKYGPDYFRRISRLRAVYIASHQGDE